MAAVTHMLLGAATLNLATCLVSLHHGQAHEILQLPRSQKVIAGLMIGHYKKGEEMPGAGHDRKALKDMYKFYE